MAVDFTEIIVFDAGARLLPALLYVKFYMQLNTSRAEPKTVDNGRIGGS